MSGKCRMHGNKEMHTIFWLDNLKGSDRSDDISLDVRIILEWTLGKESRKMCTGCIWLRIETSGRLF
jgi:hypothetical protein